jgi:hypothetical protein
MSNNNELPDFDEFCGWLARHLKGPAQNGARYQGTLAAAGAARDEFLRAQSMAQRPKPAAKYGHFETLQLLAAADKSESARPPEVMTARGFRVTLAYDEGESADSSSICVLVRCPPELIEALEGETAYLWNGTDRFELGQFDSEGKAIGTLPGGIVISMSDFAQGRVKLEEPPAEQD